MPEITRIGRSFAERRIALRLTQQTLADLAGVSRSTVQALVRGRGAGKFASVVEIAAVLGPSPVLRDEIALAAVTARSGTTLNAISPQRLPPKRR